MTSTQIVRDVDNCNSTEIKLFSAGKNPDSMKDYSDGYQISVTSTVAPQGLLANESSGTCFGNQENMTGYYCHYLTAGDSDYEFSMHTVTYWSETNTSTIPYGSFRSTDIQFGQELGSLPNGIYDANDFELRTIIASDQGANYEPESVCDPFLNCAENLLMTGGKD